LPSDLIPVGAVNLVIGSGNTVGEALTSHVSVDMGAFTGSCDTGKNIMATASKTTKRFFLDLEVKIHL
jgi:acyl-CoA reductase-like NAD-dependent aldehyde dehydrogenase